MFQRYSFLDWTLPPTPVTSGWKVREELLAWTLGGENLVFFKSTGMRDWRFSLWVTRKAKRCKHVNSLELIRFKSSLLWRVSSFGTFTSAFVLFQFSHWRLYVEECIVGECIVGECVPVFTLNTYANRDIQLHQYETHIFDFWPQLLLLKYIYIYIYMKIRYLSIHMYIMDRSNRYIIYIYIYIYIWRSVFLCIHIYIMDRFNWYIIYIYIYIHSNTYI